MSRGWLLFSSIAGCLVGLGVGAVPLSRWIRRREDEQAIQLFRKQRESLEAKFFEMASQSGKPRGLRWLKCDWQPGVTYARESQSRLLTAFVSIELHFEAIEGGDMEDVAAVDTVRDACAMFHYRHGRWGTGGKALFNMNADDVIERLQGQFVLVERSAGNASEIS